MVVSVVMAVVMVVGDLDGECSIRFSLLVVWGFMNRFAEGFEAVLFFNVVRVDVISLVPFRLVVSNVVDIVLDIFIFIIRGPLTVLLCALVHLV